MDDRKSLILYIGGAGRSGSTLLELILGNYPAFFSIGEARFFWEYVSLGNVLCGCGKRLRNCTFWSEVINSIEELGISIDEIASISKILNRTRNAILIHTNRFENRKDFHLLKSSTLELYKIINNHTNGRIIVDSSKVPSHLAILKQCEFFDLRILHLIRDGRAVVYSWTKRQKREKSVLNEEVRMPKYSLWRALFGWAAENVMVENLGKNLFYTRMRYEDFVQNPQKELVYSLSELAISEFTHDIVLSNLHILPTHSVGGNPIRFNASSKLVVTYDAEWRTKMPLYLRYGLWFAVAPIMSRYGYSLF